MRRATGPSGSSYGCTTSRSRTRFVPAERMASRTGSVVVPFDEKALRETPVRLASPSGCAREHATMLSRHYGVRVPFGDARGVRAVVPAVSRIAAA